MKRKHHFTQVAAVATLFFLVSCFYPLHGSHWQELAGQLMLVAFPGTPDDSAFEEATLWLKSSHVQNLLVSKDNFGGGSLDEQAVRVCQLKKAIAERAEGLPFFAADQEGGRVQRILGTPIPAPMVMEDENIEMYAETLARETAAVGVNMCLGPVLDIPAEENFIGDRAFGHTPHDVVRRASSWVRALKAYGLLVVGKHFPGHGASNGNTHNVPAVVSKTREELAAWEMIPFFALMHELDGIMSAHVLYPHLDDGAIGSYSPQIMKELLKGFEGLRISDSLAMLAATPEQKELEQTAKAFADSAVKALNAGCDMVILGRPEFGAYTPGPREQRSLIDRVLELVGDMLESGYVPYSRQEEALGRIRRAKNLLVQSGREGPCP